MHCRFDDAEEACRNAIEVLEEAFGPASPVTTTSLELLANIMRDTGRAGMAFASFSLHCDGHDEKKEISGSDAVYRS